MRTIYFAFFVYILLSPEAFAQGTSCVNVGGPSLTAAGCCPDLKYNSVTQICEAPTNNMQFCAKPVAPATTSATVCSVRGQGCYPQRDEDIFPETADTAPTEPDGNGNDEARRLDGDPCSESTQCESFICAPNPLNNNIKECQEKLLCRFAEVGEDLLPGTVCEQDSLPKLDSESGTMVCEQSNTDALGPNSPITVDIFSAVNNQCAFKVNDEKFIKFQPEGFNQEVLRMTGSKNLRAMEFLFANQSQDNMKVNDYLSGKVMKPFYDKHKTILTNFNIELKKIEDDEKLLKEASATSEKIVTIHISEKLKEKDLALRRASGKDAIKIMWRKNLLYQSYEQEMFQQVSLLRAKLEAFSTQIGKWKAKHKKWTIPEIGEVTGKLIKKMYTSRHRIKPKSSPENAEAMNAPAVQSYLTLIGGSLPKKKFYLLDAPFPTGSATFGVAGAQQQNMTGSGASNGLAAIKASFREKVPAFYKGLKGPNAPAGFVYEPEMIKAQGTVRIDCLEKIEDEKCKETKNLVNEVADIAFAQFIAYSAHKKGKYKKFFEKENTLRRRMMKQMVVDLLNIAKYYEELNKTRLAQSDCYAKAYNYIAKDLDDTDSNNEVNTDVARSGALGGGSPARIGTAGTINSLAVAPVGTIGQVNLLSNEAKKFFTPNLTNLGNLSNQSTTSSSSSGTSSSDNGGASGAIADSSAAGANAISRKRIAGESDAADAKDPAAAAKRNRAIALAITNLGGGGGSSSASSGSDSAALTASNSKLKDLASDAPAKVQEINEVTNKDAGLAPGAVTISESGLSNDGGTAAQAAAPDSAASEEDNEVMMANLERTRSKYDAKEEDELFDKVSKAYVRNLDKVLKRKTLD